MDHILISINVKNFIILFLLSLFSVFISEKSDFNVLNLFRNQKKKPTIFFTFYLLSYSNSPQIAFFFLEDYFIVTKFSDISYFVEPKKLSFIEFIKESLLTFLIVSALYLLLS